MLEAGALGLHSRFDGATSLMAQNNE
jgi:hypothetical protein